MSTHVESVIEIGSTAIRIRIANVTADGDHTVIERAGKPVSLGRDVFTTGIISRESIRECIAILHGFKELLRGYGIVPENTIVVATSALREAENRDAFIDRVAMRTGFKVNIIEAIEESHYMYLAVQKALGDDIKTIAKTNSIIIEVGGGSTELMLLRRGKIVAAHSLRIGTVRVDEQSKAAMGSDGYLMRYLADHVHTACDNLDSDLPFASIRSFIIIGTHARFAAKMIGTKVNDSYAIVPRTSFLSLVEDIKNLSVENIVKTYQVSYFDAELLIPGLVISALFFERTGAEELIAPFVSLRDGILVSVAGSVSHDIEDELHKQIVASITGLGRRYRFDEDHATHVKAHAMFLFDALTDYHGMSQKERLMLEAASYLHDIGNFIRSSGHHKHSEYIVLNSEIFGFQRDAISIVANVVRYHRKAGPSALHSNYMSLSREDRAIVYKLAAILRIADALDRGHTQRFNIIDIEIKEDYMTIKTDCQGDLSLERLSVTDKGDMFEDVYGFKVVIV